MDKIGQKSNVIKDNFILNHEIGNVPFILYIFITSANPPRINQKIIPIPNINERVFAISIIDVTVPFIEYVNAGNAIIITIIDKSDALIR